jgi:hypothetical protein
MENFINPLLRLIRKEGDFLRSDSGGKALQYIARLAHDAIYVHNRDPQEVRDEIEAISLKYGVDKNRARSRANGLVNPDTQHKAHLYWPFYSADKDFVEAEFNRVGGFNPGLAAYVDVTVNRTPLTLKTLRQGLAAKL